MKIAIHHREGSFSDRWINFCIHQSLNYTVVDCYKSDIINHLKEEKITHLMWHINHQSYHDLMIAPNVLNSADGIGIKTFPNFNTRWHFDDKVAQKYLLESIDAPFISSEVFYDTQSSKNFLRSAKLPLVAKLKRGAGSVNVKLIKSIEEGEAYIDKMFSTGIASSSKPLQNLDQKLRIAKKIKNPFTLINKVYNHFLKANKQVKLSDNEKGYVFFQEFMPDNEFDTRIIVVGDIAFGIRRLNKENDFRASGSGKIDYRCEEIDTEFVKIAFDISTKLDTQSLAFDFIYGNNKQPRVIEICFGFAMKAYDSCEGYWTKDLKFIPGAFNPQEYMIKDFIQIS